MHPENNGFSSLDSSSINLAVSTTFWRPGLVRIGMKLIEHQADQAAAFLYRNATSETHAQAVAFVEGSALEATIKTFDIGLNPFILREAVWIRIERQG